MIASKEIRIQEQTKRLHNGKKESSDIFIVSNNMNNLPNKEVFFKQQKEVTNIKPTNTMQIEYNKATLNQLQIPEISKMQIDSECNTFKNQQQENKKNLINNNFKNNQNGINANPANKFSTIQEAQEESEKMQHDSFHNSRNLNANKAGPTNSQLEEEIEKNKTRKDRLNEILITNYGPEIYEFSMELEKINFYPNNLKRHKIESEIRTKMIDWMIEVLSAYNSDPQTFALAVQILDLFIAKTQNVLTNNDIHLVGICSMYIASKMEDIIPLRMNHVKSKISHNKFSEKEIKKKEKIILETINFETITTSTYDFIRTFIFDFIHNNRLQIHKLNMFHHIDVFDNVAIFLSKLIYHSDEFSNFKHSLRAIACIVAAFDIMRSNSKNFSKESEDFMRQWILFLINESNYDTKLINDVYNKVVDYYNKYDNIKYISYNLSKTHTLNFY